MRSVATTSLVVMLTVAGCADGFDTKTDQALVHSIESIRKDLSDSEKQAFDAAVAEIDEEAQTRARRHIFAGAPAEDAVAGARRAAYAEVRIEDVLRRGRAILAEAATQRSALEDQQDALCQRRWDRWVQDSTALRLRADSLSAVLIQARLSEKNEYGIRDLLQHITVTNNTPNPLSLVEVKATLRGEGRTVPYWSRIIALSLPSGALEVGESHTWTRKFCNLAQNGLYANCLQSEENLPALANLEHEVDFVGYTSTRGRFEQLLSWTAAPDTCD